MMIGAPILGLFILSIIGIPLLLIAGRFFAGKRGAGSADSMPVAHGMTLNCPHCGSETAADRPNCKQCGAEI